MGREKIFKHSGINIIPLLKKQSSNTKFPALEEICSISKCHKGFKIIGFPPEITAANRCEFNG